MRKSEYAALVKACSIAFCPNYHEEQRMGAELIVKRIEQSLKLEGLCKDAREEEENRKRVNRFSESVCLIPRRTA